MAPSLQKEAGTDEIILLICKKYAMDKAEILQQVNAVFIDVLDNDKIVLAKETTASDVDEWDSLNHIQLVVAIEKQFKIRFTSREIQSWKNVGEMVDSISAKINPA
jgi:acyl carrier protein